MPFKLIRQFLQLEASSSIFLLLGALLGIIIVNSPLATFYQTLIFEPFNISIAHLQATKPLLFWINEGLMTLFFLLIGLELKGQLLAGDLANLHKVVLPGIAALGGMIIPAIFYMAINYNDAIALKGWATPVATDIAFALGVLSFFGKRVPLNLKLFLMAIAIFDDLGAIFIIAIFHTRDLSWISIIFALGAILILIVLNRLRIRSFLPFLIMGLFLWFCVLKSGIHATIAGVIFSLLIPPELTQKIEDTLHLWVAFGVMPLFAFANAGVSLAHVNFSSFFNTITLGIILGLVLGKPIGIISFTWVAIRLRLTKLPVKISWPRFFGMSFLCGIGFTMSLFLGTLAFEHESPLLLVDVRLGVLIGSLLSGIVGMLILNRVLRSLKRGKNRGTS